MNDIMFLITLCQFADPADDRGPHGKTANLSSVVYQEEKL